MEDKDVEQVLENDVKGRNEEAYDFVGDVVWATCFLCVNLPEYVSHFTEPDSDRISGSKGMTFWKFSLALVMGWSNLASTSVFTSSSKTLFSIPLVKTPPNWDVVTALLFIPTSSLETRVG